MLTVLEKSKTFPKGVLDIDVSTSDVINIIVTRFFLVNFRICKFKDADFDEYKYLEYRCNLFMKVCYPSIISQLSESDRWYLFVSEPFIGYVKEKLGNIDERVIICDYNREAMIQKIDTYVSDNKLPCVTRIDNDDTLSLEYIQLMNKVSKKLSETNDYGFVMFPCGLQKDLVNNDCRWFMYNITHTFSVFYKLPVSKNSNLWIFSFDHTKLYENDINITTLNTTLPMWAENVSDTNQANSIKVNTVKIDQKSPVLMKIFPSLFE